MWYMYMYLQSSVVKSYEGGGGGAQPIIIEGMQAVQPNGNIVLLLYNTYEQNRGGRVGVLTKSGLPAWFCSLHKRNIYVPYALGRCFQSVSASEDGFQLQKLKKGI